MLRIAMHLQRPFTIAIPCFAIIAMTSAPSVADAGNTAGVFGPVVNAGHRSAEYRLGYDAENHAFAQRFHYQQSIDNDRMWRVIAQARKTETADADFNFLQGELFWQFDDLGKGWAHGLRFDVRLRDAGRPALVGVNWTHQFDFSTGWRARLLVMSSWELGGDAPGGVFLQTRASLGYSPSRRYLLEMLMFSAYGSTDNLAVVDEQFHQAGPAVSVGLGHGWRLVAGYLAGITDATPDDTYRLWISTTF